MNASHLLLLSCAAAYAATLEPIASGEKFVEPFGIDFDRAGNMYVCEHKGEKITKIDKAGKATSFAGTGTAGLGGDGGPASQAQFKDPHGLVIRRDQMYIADTLNHRIRKIDMKTNVITTIAGTGEPGYSGDGGPAVKAAFNGTFAIALSKRGERLYVADLNNRRVRAIDLKSGIVTTVAGNGQRGVPQDGARAAESSLVDPRAVAADSKGNLYILERGGNALRVVDPRGMIRTVIAPETVQPNLNGPKHLCVDRDDSVIIADAENNLLRRYTPKDGKTITIAGTGKQGTTIVPGEPLKSELTRPHGVTIDRSGVLYISDSYNHRLLRMRP
jgi:DNA-binding beta-propeller fold protein YncE